MIKNEITEHQIQVSCVAWFRAFYRNKYVIASFNNQGKRSMGHYMYAVSEGFQNDMPDLFIAVPNDKYHGFFIEMKRNERKVTNPAKSEIKHLNAQKAMLERLRAQGYKAEFMWSYDMFVKEVSEYLKDIKKP